MNALTVAIGMGHGHTKLSATSIRTIPTCTQTQTLYVVGLVAGSTTIGE
jgi:hypothetical protein